MKEEINIMSSRAGNGEGAWSRRRLMSVLAGAGATSAVVVATMSTARADDWQEYLREDMGFRIEMPGEPEVDVKEEGVDDKIVRLIDAQVYDDEDDGLFGVHCTEYRDPVSAEQEYR